MRLAAKFCLLAALWPAILAAAPAPAPVETIVFVRHGEKPPGDLGQLTFQGLNRALALPRVLISKYGKANAIFAPCTTKLVHHGVPYSYVRPLITIEPTAIRLGLPIEAKYKYDDLGGLQKALLKKENQSALIFVAWEHVQLVKEIRRIVRETGGDPAIIPDWPGKDFDSIYVLRLMSAAGGKRTVTFTHDHEGLNGESVKSPKPAGA